MISSSLLVLFCLIVIPLCAIFTPQLRGLFWPGPTSAAPSTSRRWPKSLRITGIPTSWSKEKLLDTLCRGPSSFSSSLNGDSFVALYPGCYHSSQTAILTLESCPDFMERMGLGDTRSIKINDESVGEIVWLSTDYDFYDLTPLNKPEGDIIAEFVHYPRASFMLGLQPLITDP